MQRMRATIASSNQLAYSIAPTAFAGSPKTRKAALDPRDRARFNGFCDPQSKIEATAFRRYSNFTATTCPNSAFVNPRSGQCWAASNGESHVVRISPDVLLRCPIFSQMLCASVGRSSRVLHLEAYRSFRCRFRRGANGEPISAMSSSPAVVGSGTNCAMEESF